MFAFKFVIFLLLPLRCYSDLPIHCDFGSAPGVWRFVFGRLQRLGIDHNSDLTTAGVSGSSIYHLGTEDLSTDASHLGAPDSKKLNTVFGGPDEFDNRCGQTVPGTIDGWHDLSPYTGNMENRYLNKYHFTTRFQPVGEIDFLLKQGNLYEDAAIRILGRRDWEVNPEKQWPKDGTMRRNGERLEQIIHMVRDEIGGEGAATRAATTVSTCAEGDSCSPDVPINLLSTRILGGESETNDEQIRFFEGTLDDDQKILVKQLLQTALASASILGDVNTVARNKNGPTRQDPEFESQLKGLIARILLSFYQEASGAEGDGKISTASKTLDSLTPDDAGRIRTKRLRFLRYLQAQYDQVTALRRRIKHSKYEWKELEGQHLTDDLQTGETGGYSTVNDIGNLLSMHFDKSSEESPLLTEHTWFAPARFVIPPGKDEHEGDVNVNRKDSDCQKTNVGRWKEILLDTLSDKHNRIESELCYYGYMLEPWDAYIEKNPDELRRELCEHKGLVEEKKKINEETKNGRVERRKSQAARRNSKQPLETAGDAMIADDGSIRKQKKDITENGLYRSCVCTSTKKILAEKGLVAALLIPEQLCPTLCADYRVTPPTGRNKGKARPALCPIPSYTDFRITTATSQNDWGVRFMFGVVAPLVTFLFIVWVGKTGRHMETRCEQRQGALAVLHEDRQKRMKKLNPPTAAAERTGSTRSSDNRNLGATNLKLSALSDSSLDSGLGGLIEVASDKSNPLYVEHVKVRSRQEKFYFHISAGNPEFWRLIKRFAYCCLLVFVCAWARAHIVRARVEKRLGEAMEVSEKNELSSRKIRSDASSDSESPRERCSAESTEKCALSKLGKELTEPNEGDEFYHCRHSHKIKKLKQQYLIGYDNGSKRERQRVRHKFEMADWSKNNGKHLYDLPVDDLLAGYPEPVDPSIAGYEGDDRFYFQNKQKERVYMDVDGWKTVKDFDWRFVSKKIKKDPSRGIEKDELVTGFVPEVVDQGQCGDCYTAGFTHMITGRYWIQNPESKKDFFLKGPIKGDFRDALGNEMERFSMYQHLEGCDYNQHCDGGDPMLEALWSQEYPVVQMRCWDLLRTIVDDEVRLRVQETHPLCKHQLQVTNFFYVGGAIGGCAVSNVCAELIMRELWANGPVDVAVEMSGFRHGSPWDAKMIHDKEIARINREFKNEFDVPERYSWTMIEHAVAIHGWGEDTVDTRDATKSLISCKSRLHTLPEDHKKCTDIGSQQDVELKYANNLGSPAFKKELKEKEATCNALHHCKWEGNTWWAFQNSWGRSWGDKGYAKYGPRGHDALIIEYAVFISNVKKVNQKVVYASKEGR